MSRDRKTYIKDAGIRYEFGGCLSCLTPPSERMNNITKKNSMRVERMLADVLIKSKIPFEFKKIINNKEVDFLINGKLAVELDGVHHLLKRKLKSDADKNKELLVAGYSIFRIRAKEVKLDIQKIINRIKQWERQEF